MLCHSFVLEERYIRKKWTILMSLYVGLTNPGSCLVMNKSAFSSCVSTKRRNNLFHLRLSSAQKTWDNRCIVSRHISYRPCEIFSTSDCSRQRFSKVYSTLTTQKGFSKSSLAVPLICSVSKCLKSSGSRVEWGAIRVHPRRKRRTLRRRRSSCHKGLTTRIPPEWNF